MKFLVPLFVSLGLFLGSVSGFTTSVNVYAEFGNWGYLNSIMNANYVHYEDVAIRIGGNGSQQGPWSAFWGFELDFSEVQNPSIQSVNFHAFGITKIGGGPIYLSDSRGISISEQPRGSSTQNMNYSGKGISIIAGQESVVDLTHELSNLIQGNRNNEISLVVAGGGGNWVNVGNSLNGIPAYLEITYIVPEPSTYAILLGGTVLGYAFWRRRK